MGITSQEKLLIKIVKILNNLKIKYFITGGFAVSVWGRPRATFDIDIVVKLIKPQAIPLTRALRKISKEGYADENMIKEAIQHKGEFNFIDPSSGLKVDFWVVEEKISAPPEFENRKLKKINNQNVYFISPEDLILSKLQWYKQTQSSRHSEDIQSVLKISGKKLNMKYLKKWAEKLGLLEIFNELKV
ncbi:MAG: hypothetical protein CO034_01770 [Parcubacteria group bacterium CG_4_9_14_0_2_um_filter_35_11]|nr:MAG: hypothetical protein CO034_01770 [Parcubacteria group bacterium CG_4_9_14_0_2_um_filter_35_11]